MKKYLKILLITLSIQIGCWIAGILFGQLPAAVASKAAFLIVLGFPISFVADVILAVKWGDKIREKLIYILLMPTNYTWILTLWILYMIMKKGLEILNSLPANFG